MDIVYSTTSFNSELIPTWIIEDYDNFLLNGTSPAVTENTNFSFYIEAASPVWTSNLKKLITISVGCPTSWTVGNCTTCETCFTDRWKVWNSGFIVNSTNFLWVERDIWGDGVIAESVTDTTYWDDGNLVNGDGCNSTCAEEVGWECTRGSLTQKSVCTQFWFVQNCKLCLNSNSSRCDIWEIGYLLNSTNFQCEEVCLLANWLVCKSGDFSQWEIWDSGFELDSLSLWNQIWLPTNCDFCVIFNENLWKNCSSGFRLTSSKLWETIPQNGMADENKWNSFPIYTSLTILALLNLLICFCLNYKSSRVFWNLISQLQMISVLLLLKNYGNDESNLSIKNQGFLVYTLDYIPFNYFKYCENSLLSQTENILKYVVYQPDLNLLKDYGFSEESTIARLSTLILVILLGGIIHVLLLLFGKYLVSIW